MGKKMRKGRNGKTEETGRNKKKWKDAGRNRKKLEEMG